MPPSSEGSGAGGVSGAARVRLKHKQGLVLLLQAGLALLLASALTGVAANHPPRFLIDGQTEIVLRLKEGNETPVGSLIYRLRGADPDGDALTFGVRGSEGHDMLRIENLGTNEANVYLNKELDREVRDEYLLVLTLTDGRLGEGNFITQSLLLLVEDVNDNEPVFKPYAASLTVREDAEPGVLTTVEATDLDEGAYGQVVYYLQELDGDDDLFSISTVNGKGVLRLAGRLDYERKFLYQIRVLAVDRAINERVNTGTAAILVKVQDVEDQPPEFVVVPAVSRVSEDSRIGTSVLQVKAVDGDRGINNPISYSITRGAHGVFEIDANSGIVFTLQKLDREGPLTNNGAYILEIMAQEDSKLIQPPPTTRTEVTVILMDVNDETPTFRSPAYFAEVNENAPVNTPVTFLRNAVPEVFDHDQGNNGTFIMFIEGDRGIFDVTPPKGINEATFLVRVKESTKLDYEKTKVMNFTLVAKETVPNNAKYSAVPLTVHIRDVNDNVPEFDKNVYEVSVPENSMKGTTVAKIVAKDADSGEFGTAGIRYTELRGSVADILHLDPLTGVITIKAEGSSFDREVASRFYLTVEVRDDLGRGNRNTVQLIVNIADVNDNAPEFLQSEYEARLLEDSTEFESPLVIEARDLDLNGTRHSMIHYSIIDGDPFGNFTLDPVTGILKPTAPIDFEQLVGTRAASEEAGGPNVRPIRMVVQAQDLGVPPMWSQALVTVYVQDVNDHTPQFEQGYYLRSIPEDLPGGSSVLQVKAWDADGSSPNNRVVYRIQQGAEDKFVMDADTGIVTVAHGANLDPDRSDPKSNLYAMVVVALDGGIGARQRHASVPVNITIVDVNNKAPVFQEPGTIHVRENTPVGQPVYKVVATDLDAKPVLRYRIDPDNSEARTEEGTIVKSTEYDYLSVFELGPLDGSLRVARLLDREQVESIRLALVVEDLAAAKGKQIASAVLTIIVDDENDNNPKFRRPFYRRSIPENSQTGSMIVSIVADDADKNRTITYSLEAPRLLQDLVHLDAETGEMVVANRIDFEQHNWLNFTVKATDSGVPSRASHVEVFIQILDENDNNPYFIGDITNITVREDAPIGTEIATIQAKDADSGDYGKVTFLLDRISSLGKFQIDPDTGVLNVSDKLNREEQSSYLLVIEAWDNYQFGYASGESRNAFKQIGVNIVDVNDEIPVFEPINGCVHITEFHEPHETVTVVKASDADDPNTPNGRIKFSIAGGNEQELFEIENIDLWSARIISTTSLKARYGNYTLKLMAQDLGSPPNSVTMELSICVLDINDNAPRFISPPHNITIRVPENATIGSTVIQVEAVDEDIGPNGAVRYRLRQDLSGDWRTFAIDDVNGIIHLRQPLDRERQKTYQLRVEAYDLGIPTPLSSDLDLTIYVRNVNDYEPQFLVDEFTVNFTEHSPPGHERRILIDTVDRDEVDELDDPPTPVCYYIVAGNKDGLFALEPLRHELLVAKELDREVASEHILLIKASEDCLHRPSPRDIKSVETSNSLSYIPVDGASNLSLIDGWTFDPKDDTLLRVIIKVVDINDNPPHFVKKVFTGGVTTEADFGTEFMQVTAVDPDDGVNAVVNYYQIGRVQMTLSEGMENIQHPPFLVDRDTGGVHLNFDPQRGMKGYFDFMVLANDTGGLQDMARVFIYLLREDQRVRFVLRQHPPEVREKIDVLREVLGNVTGAIVNVDEYKVHENHDGSVDKTKTDLYLHFVNKRDNSIMEVGDVLRLVDQNIESLDTLFKEFNVLDTMPAEAIPLKAEAEQLVWVWLVSSTVLLGMLLLLVLSICLSQRASYQRQLKAATATAFGSTDSALGQASGRVPNTNMHSTEGSNPIWMQAYENEWYKEEDSEVQTSDRDSLDENAVTAHSEAIRAAPQPNGGTFISSERQTVYSDSCNSRSNMLPAGGSSETATVTVSVAPLKEQNDLNRIGTMSTYHQNLYQHLDKLSNPLISKKLETTEL
ncbi:hypothetical protein ONE63_002512 [Megalurothrips usitatus]|uniref:Cadherin domain-containing protein n=1 Tax=Megalurothrips usitatus TaxID=439358 RepID=A0AAV7X8D2_9NEOP|nr:hypothetical protein ONE63_002512 [Megalurothrips usitatus]